MPELPEVQVVINYLKQNILNKKIKHVDVYLDKLIKNVSINEFKDTLIGHYFKDILRKGKYLLFILDNNHVMLSHLRMEGKYNYETDATKSKHDHIIFSFNDNTFLKYNDTRQFGTFELYANLNSAYNSSSLSKLGIDPINETIDEKILYNKIKKSHQKIKTFLLDQTNITGIGNIYANEICYAIGIHPETIANKLTKQDVHKLVETTINILKDSIRHNGTTIHSFSFSK